MAEIKYEVEIKCLVGDKTEGERLPDVIRERGYDLKQTAEYHQLNDYYEAGDPARLAEKLRPIVDEQHYDTMQKIIAENDSFSVRGRQNNDAVLFMLKASKGGSANHAAQRAELEASVSISLDELKDVIVSAGYKVQARWMAHRKIYQVSNGIILDNLFSPGYGYQAEFELVVDGKDKTAEAEKRVRAFAKKFGLEPVDPARIERMFEYYNLHWQEYYGTEKVFTVQ